MALDHLGWPYTPGLTVVQDTDAARKAATAALAATPRGAIEGLPTLGVTTPLFGVQPVDAAAIAAEINEYDQSLRATASSVVDVTEPQVARIPITIS